MLYTRHNPKWFVRIFELGNGRDILDLCRLQKINVPGSVYVLRMDDNDIVCDNAYPTLSSIQIDYERAAFLAARALDEMISARDHTKVLPHLTCGFKDINERASTQDPRGTGRLTALACDYIEKNVCRPGGLDQYDIARHLGVSVRTLQMRFKGAYALLYDGLLTRQGHLYRKYFETLTVIEP